jgi:hypothetical protein
MEEQVSGAEKQVPGVGGPGVGRKGTEKQGRVGSIRTGLTVQVPGVRGRSAGVRSALA